MLKKSVILAVFLIVVFAGVAFSLPLGADLIEFNGLKWLSPVHSAGIQTYKMLNYFADPTSDYYGLRHATRYELDELARGFGFDVQPYQSATKAVHPNDQLPQLTQLFGVTLHRENLPSDLLSGVIAESSNIWRHYQAYFYDFYDNNDTFFIDTYSSASTHHNGDDSAHIGHWLIAEGSLFPTPDNTLAPIPEPSTFALISCGLVALFYFGKRRKS